MASPGKTVTKPRQPYARKTVSDDEHRQYMMLAEFAASRSAKAIANHTLRLGVAHRYMIAAHLQQLMDGGGEEQALDFLEELVGDLCGRG